MAKGDDLEERLINFAVRIVKMCNQLPRRASPRHISDQVLRSGTSPAANYAEARRAESTRDFIHKLKIALKELNETRIWLHILARSDIVLPRQMQPLIGECDELCRILSSSIKTTTERQPNKQPPPSE
ncbi:MAG: four helix bundle protein [Chloroflexi bacterium]|nr:MAG: four helix bundle protein [Chloroflexota bacterium]